MPTKKVYMLRKTDRLNGVLDYRTITIVEGASALAHPNTIEPSTRAQVVDDYVRPSIPPNLSKESLRIGGHHIRILGWVRGGAHSPLASEGVRVIIYGF